MQPSEANYQLPPFPPYPTAARYVALGSVEKAIERISSSIASRDGIALLIGPPGTGKSLACSALAKQYDSSHTVVCLGDIEMPTAESFYRRLLHQFGVDMKTIPDNDMHVAVVDLLQGDQVADGGVLLLIDEAQSLNAEVLEAVRTLTNVMKNGQPSVTSIVCGSPKLEETLAVPSMEAFNQRVGSRCYLHPYNAHETRYYISETIRGCGSDPNETITDEAMGAVHHACSGVPRLINQLMTEAIDCAAEMDETLIDERVIDEAWARLQQLPSPMVEEAKIASNAPAVEFGSLEMDEPTDAPPSGLAPAAATAPAAISGPAPATAPVAASFEPQAATCSSRDNEACDESGPKICEGTTAGQRESVTLNEPVIFHAIEEDLPTVRETRAVETQPAATPVSVATPAPAPAVARGFDAPLPANLFGSFEYEENVSVNEPSQPSFVPEPEPISAEARVHADVIQLSEMATQARFGGLDPDNRMGELMEESSDFALKQTPTWTPKDQDDISVRSCSDDSDMLIIEDEVDVVPRPMLPQADADGDGAKTVKVDFQKMLHQMRSGT